MRIETVNNALGACVLCRGPIFGEALLLNDFNYVCLDCAGKIADYYINNIAPVEVNTKSVNLTCPICGKEFGNKGALVSHLKSCLKSYKGDDKG